MFCRLNLAKLNCKELSIVVHLKLSRTLAERIFKGSVSRKKDNVPYSTAYGCIYSRNREPYVLVVVFEHAKGDVYHIQFRYLAEEWPRPPRNITSPDKLVTLFSEEPQAVEFSCNAYFEYDEKKGWKSVIELPISIPSKKEGDRAFTHIESIRLSKRERKKIQYSIQFRRTRQGMIRHWVYFSGMHEEGMSEKLPEQVLKRAVKMSRAFINEEKQEEQGNGSSSG